VTRDDHRILEAAREVGSASSDGFVKCDRVIRHALREAWNDEMEVAACVTGYEDAAVAAAYDAIRSLVKRGLLDGRGDLALPAGPRYTECRLNAAGHGFLGDGAWGKKA
jgi:hypothetical protein